MKIIKTGMILVMVFYLSFFVGNYVGSHIDTSSNFQDGIIK